MSEIITQDDFSYETYNIGKIPKFNDKRCSVILWYVDWCKFCREFLPQWEKLSELMPSINSYRIDCTKNKDLCNIMKHFGVVKSFPTITFYKNGKFVKKFLGERKDSILIEEYMNICNI